MITTFDGRVMEYSGGRFTQLPARPGRAGSGYLGFGDADGRWWVVQQWFVGSWDGTNWLPAAAVTNLFSKINGGGAARDGGLRLVSGQNLWKYRPDEPATRVALLEWPGHPWSVTEDSQGNVWIATYDQGVSLISPSGAMRRWTTTNGLSYNGTRCVFEDRERNLWLGTSGGGLQRFKPRRAHGFGAESGLTDRNVTSVQPDGAGGLWLATYAQGIFRWRDGSIAPVPLPPNHNTLTVVNSVLTDRAGRTWFGTWGQSVCMLDTNGFHRFPTNQTGGFNVLALFEDSGGRIWAGGEREISVGDHQGFQRVGQTSGASLAGVRCGAEDRDGRLWVSNLEGLYRLEQNQFTEIRSDGAPVRDITCLKADADGTMWLGALNGGLRCWRNGRFIRTRLGGAPDPEPGIHGILDDGGGEGVHHPQGEGWRALLLLVERHADALPHSCEACAHRPLRAG